MTPKIVKFALSVEEQLLRQFDEKWKREGYQGRSEAFRALVRNYLKTA